MNTQEAAIEVSLEELAGLNRLGRSLSLQALLKSPLAGAEGRVMRQAGMGLEFRELRSYQPGDDPRSIDWKVTARRGQTFSRVYAAEYQRPVALFVDQASALQFGSLASKAVMAARIAALLGWAALADREKVGGWILTDEGSFWQPPKAGSSAWLPWLAGLAAKNQSLGALQPRPPGQLDQALAEFRQRLPASSLVILISDFRGFTATQLLQAMSRQSALLAIQLTDPWDQQLPAVAAPVANQDDQQPLSASLRRAWSQGFAEEQLRLRQALGQQGRYLEISTRDESRLMNCLLPVYNRKNAINKVR